MSWQTVFKKYQIAEIGKKGKLANTDNEQVSQFPLFPYIGEQELQKFLGEDWELYKDNPEALAGWADLLSERKQMERGEIPKDFTTITHCASCGDVFVPPAIANNGSVQGCPWCLNNAKGLPIPHPITNNQQLE